MAVRYLAGDPGGWNFVARASSIAGTDERALFPWSEVKDARPATIGRFNSLVADGEVKVDLNIVSGPTMGSGWGATPGYPPGWTETGDVLEGTGGDARSGSSVFVSASDYVHQDITVRAGEKLKFDGWTKAGASSAGAVKIRNLRTGNFLQTGWGSWGSGDTWAANSSSTSYANVAGTFTVEDYDTVRADTCPLRLTLLASAGTAFWDDAYLFPAVNFASVHGHNLDPSLTFRVRHSDDDSTYTNVSMTVADPAFYAVLSEVYKRWWKFQYVGTPLRESVFYGELVLGQIATLSKEMRPGMEEGDVWIQTRTETRGGQLRVYPISQTETRTRVFDFRHTDATTAADLRDRLVRRSQGGRWPMILVPSDSEAAVLYGNLDEGLKVTRTPPIRDTGLKFTEAPFPLVIA